MFSSKALILLLFAFLLLPAVAYAQVDCSDRTEVFSCLDYSDGYDGYDGYSECTLYCECDGFGTCYPCEDPYEIGECDLSFANTCISEPEQTCRPGCVTDEDCAGLPLEPEEVGCKKWLCDTTASPQVCYKAEELDGTSCPVPDSVEARDAECRNYACSSGTCNFEVLDKECSAPPGVSAENKECRKYECYDGYCPYDEMDFTAKNEGKSVGACSGFTSSAPSEACEEYECDFTGNCNTTECDPGDKHPYCTTFFQPAETDCKFNACHGGFPVYDEAGGLGIVEMYCAAFEKEGYEGKVFHCASGPGSVGSELWKDVQTRSLTDAGSMCCGFPICYDNAEPGIDPDDPEGKRRLPDPVNERGTENEHKVLHGVTGQYNIGYKCIQASQDSEGWRRVEPYSKERCENMGLSGTCYTKRLWFKCGDGEVQLDLGEQCDPGSIATGDMHCFWTYDDPPGSGSFGAFRKCTSECKCVKVEGTGGGGGSGEDGGGVPLFSVCEGLRCVLRTLDLVPLPMKFCMTNADCDMPVGGQHKACDGPQCKPFPGEGQNECLTDADCSALAAQPPVADATVGDDTTGKNAGCGGEDYFPSFALVFPSATAVTLHSDRDGWDADCLPSYDEDDCAAGESNLCPSIGTYDYLLGMNNPNCCLQYAWQCVSSECPDLSNHFPPTLISGRTRDKNPTFSAGADDIGKVFEFQLTVMDSGENTSRPSKVTVAVAPAAAECTALDANPAEETGPFDSLLTATFTDMPDGMPVTFDCGNDTFVTAPVSAGTAIAACSYDAVASDETHNASASVGSISCPTATITNKAPPVGGYCQIMGAEPGIIFITGEGPPDSTEVTIYYKDLFGGSTPIVSSIVCGDAGDADLPAAQCENHVGGEGVCTVTCEAYDDAGLAIIESARLTDGVSTEDCLSTMEIDVYVHEMSPPAGILFKITLNLEPTFVTQGNDFTTAEAVIENFAGEVKKADLLFTLQNAVTHQEIRQMLLDNQAMQPGLNQIDFKGFIAAPSLSEKNYRLVVEIRETGSTMLEGRDTRIFTIREIRSLTIPEQNILLLPLVLAIVLIVLRRKE